MLCPNCGANSAPGDAICALCAAPLTAATSEGVPTPAAGTDVVEITPAVAPQPYQWKDVWLAPEPTNAISTTAMSTTAISTTATPTTATPTIGLPAITRPALSLPVFSNSAKTASRTTGLTVVAGLAAVGGASAIVGSFLAQLTISSDAPVADVLGDYKLNDLAQAFHSGGLYTGSNLQTGVIVAAVLLMVGAAFAFAGHRFGAGLLGGAAVALAPVVVVVWGNITRLGDSAAVQAQDARNISGIGTFIDTGPSIGFYFLAGGAVVALIALIVSLAMVRPDNRLPLNGALCLTGALASLVAAAGQLVPEPGAKFSTNVSTDSVSTLLMAARLAIIALVAVCGVIGFSMRSRRGIALVLGAVSIYVWQWLSSLIELGDFPAEPAFGRPGSIEVKPHITTTIGVIVMLLLAASTLAITGRHRQGAR